MHLFIFTALGDPLLHISRSFSSAAELPFYQLHATHLGRVVATCLAGENNSNNNNNNGSGSSSSFSEFQLAGGALVGRALRFPVLQRNDSVSAIALAVSEMQTAESVAAASRDWKALTALAKEWASLPSLAQEAAHVSASMHKEENFNAKEVMADHFPETPASASAANSVLGKAKQQEEEEGGGGEQEHVSIVEFPVFTQVVPRDQLEQLVGRLANATTDAIVDDGDDGSSVAFLTDNDDEQQEEEENKSCRCSAGSSWLHIQQELRDACGSGVNQDRFLNHILARANGTKEETMHIGASSCSLSFDSVEFGDRVRISFVTVSKQ